MNITERKNSKELNTKLRIAIHESLGPKGSSAIVEILKLPHWVFYYAELEQRTKARARSHLAGLKRLELELTQVKRVAEQVERTFPHQIWASVEDQKSEPDFVKVGHWINTSGELLKSVTERIRIVGRDGGRPTKLGPFHSGLALWGAMERANVPERKRPSTIKSCLVAIGIKDSEITTAIRKVRAWHRTNGINPSLNSSG